MTHTGSHQQEPLGLDAPRCIPAEHIHVEQCCRAGAAELAAVVAAVVARAEKAEAERDALGAAYDDLEAARLQTMEQRDVAREQLGMVRGLLAAYGEAEGSPVDYEFLVSQLTAALDSPAAALRAAERAEESS